MENKFCIIVPTYNAFDTIVDVVNELKVYDLPIIVVDDGSNQQTKDSIETAKKQSNLVTVITRATNGGKGAAVIDGIKWANENNFTNAIQIDADKQHVTKDIPLFIKCATKDPSALVLGTPVFPANTPKSRLNGRKISIAWVAIETLSFAIKDPLFGYRVYPVKATYNLIKKINIGTRMDFDPEIAVRLYWSGVEVINQDSPVIYRNDGSSHFRMVKDNIIITWMHTRLFFGMLFRIARLLKRQRAK